MATHADRPQLLFLISHDFGELANALYFLEGGAFDVRLLMPERLLAINRASLPCPAFAYRSVDDVLEAMRVVRPDILFLFSGYLFVINQLFREAELEKLIAEASPLCRLVTSDPFLNVMSTVHADTISRLHPRHRTLIAHFSRLHALFSEIAHLYLGEVPAGAKQGMSFFNPRILKGTAELSKHHSLLAARLVLTADTPRWLFVLSQEDYASQGARLGRDQFDAQLARLLMESVALGKAPVLIAPRPCLEAQSARGGLPAQALLLRFCDCQLFQSLLVDAELAFYWNILSNSILIRLVNRLPAMFFAPGHLAEAIPPLFEAGMAHYYGRAPIAYLDASKPLNPSHLAELAERQTQDLEAMRRRLCSLPSPAALISILLARLS